jgi:hypothetical protein
MREYWSLSISIECFHLATLAFTPWTPSKLSVQGYNWLYQMAISSLASSAHHFERSSDLLHRR